MNEHTQPGTGVRLGGTSATRAAEVAKVCVYWPFLMLAPAHQGGQGDDRAYAGDVGRVDLCGGLRRSTGAGSCSGVCSSSGHQIAPEAAVVRARTALIDASRGDYSILFEHGRKQYWINIFIVSDGPKSDMFPSRQ